LSGRVRRDVLERDDLLDEIVDDRVEDGADAFTEDVGRKNVLPESTQMVELV
jgi:hypothetical protein